MSPLREVCIDGGLGVKTVVTEPDSDKADALVPFDSWNCNRIVNKAEMLCSGFNLAIIDIRRLVSESCSRGNYVKDYSDS
jgi:hypothetical protein